MRITTACLLLCFTFTLMSTSAVCQQTHPSASPPLQHSETSSSSGVITVQGCITGGQEAYTLTQEGTGVTFKLLGNSTQFQDFRGKSVEVTGREFPPTSRRGMNDLPRLAANKMRMTGGHCPAVKGYAPSPAGTPTGIPQAKDGQPQNQPPTAATPRYASPGAPNQTPPTVGNNPNVGGATGTPSPGTGNPPPPSPPPARFKNPQSGGPV